MEVEVSSQNLMAKGQYTGLSYNDLLYDCPPRKWSRIEKAIVTYIFRKFVNDGSVELVFGDNDRVTVSAGSGKPHFAIRPPGIFSILKILSNPDLQTMETYVNREWTCINCDLSDFVAFLYIQNNSPVSKWRRFTRKLPFPRFLFKQYITPIKSTRRTSLHYNVSTDFYEKLLHPTMSYTCAFFESEQDNLQQAQQNKIAKVAERVGFTDKPAKVLDMGCGWGEAVSSIAKKYPKLSLEGISIAAAQVDYANEAFGRRGSSRFELCDFRLFRPNEEAVYDYIYSIGMVEHVGKTRYGELFYHVHRLLKPGGKAVFHTIIRRKPGKTNSWIDKHVFPGCYPPLLSEVMNGIERSGLINLNCHVHIGENYYKTIQCWKLNLLKQYDTMLPMLADEAGKEKNVTSRRKFYLREFRRWYAYLSATQSFFLDSLEAGAICHFVMQKKPAF